MSTWTEDQLQAVAAAAELHIRTHRPDGTLLDPAPIWVVRAGDSLYVRSWKGTGGTWFSRASRGGTARITAGGGDADVIVSLAGGADRDRIDRIDQAYRAKYARYGQTYLAPMVAGQAAETTLQLTPSP
jgi:hypothetical protein